jgi:hypothetical protein
MAALFHPIRTLRENLRQIGAAVSASREFSLASQSQQDAREPSSGIPF